MFTVLPVNQAQGHPLQKHVAPAIAAALDTRSPTVLSVLLCLSGVPLSVFALYKIKTQYNTQTKLYCYFKI